MKKIILLFAALMIYGCLGIPENISPVGDFDIEQYLGTWYEIARLDHSFEEGLDSVTATYSYRDDGGIKVVNRGFSIEDNEWNKAEGKAYFVDDKEEGYLKVSFFGPFYGSYIIFELDKDNYQYAFVTSSNKSYLWFLSRTPKVSQEMTELFLERAETLGFDTSEIIFVKQ